MVLNINSFIFKCKENIALISILKRVKGLESEKGRNSFCIHHLSPYKSENKKNTREGNPDL